MLYETWVCTLPLIKWLTHVNIDLDLFNWTVRDLIASDRNWNTTLLAKIFSYNLASSIVSQKYINIMVGLISSGMFELLRQGFQL